MNPSIPFTTEKTIIGGRWRLMKIMTIAIACASIAAIAQADNAQAAIRQATNIQAQDLEPALKSFAQDRRLYLIYASQDITALHTNGAVGELTADQALAKLLNGTGLVYRYIDDNTITIMPATSAGAAGGSAALSPQTGAVKAEGSKAPPKDSFRMAQADREVAGGVVSVRKEDNQGPPGATRQSDKVQLEEIVVTANKREQTLLNVPSSITAETAAALARRGALRLEDIIDNTPGLSNPGSGAGNSTNLTIRGVTTGTDLALKQSTVALLLDDIPVDVGPGGGATNLRIVDIQRVEVLRGPQGTLFGSGSLSGAVRYITNKPDFEEYSGSGEITGEGTQTGAGSYSGSVVVNAPLIPGALAVRAVGYRFREGGWIDDLRTGETNTNFTDTYGGRFAVAARPSDALSATVTLAYQDSLDNTAGASYYNKPTTAEQSGQVYDGILPVPYDIHSTLYNVFLQYDFDRVSVISSSTYQRRIVSQTGENFGDDPLTTGIATGFQDIVNGPANVLIFRDEDNYTQELRLSSRASTTLKWTVGGFYLYSGNHGGDQEGSSLVAPVIGGDNIVDLDYHQSQQELSAFGELTWTAADKWDLTAGARVSDMRVRSTAITGGFLPVFSVSPDAYVTTHFREDDSPVNPRASVAYRVDPDLMIYAQAARGFRVGGVNLTSGVGGRDTPGTYRSDDLWNYEIGAKGKVFDGSLLYSVAAYYIDWKNIQVSLQNQIGQYTGNAGEAGLYGLEMQVDNKPVDWLTVGAALSVSHNAITDGNPTIVRPATGLVGVSDGDRLPASPESQASAYAQYEYHVMGHEAYTRLSAHYIGPEYTDFAKTGTEFGNFAAADLRTGIRLNHWEVIGFVDNLTNDQGKTGAVDPQLVGPVVLSHQDAIRIRPRTIGLTVRANF
jgi:iron complex outermembrane receptor protein